MQRLLTVSALATALVIGALAIGAATVPAQALPAQGLSVVPTDAAPRREPFRKGRLALAPGRLPSLLVAPLAPLVSGRRPRA